MAEIRIPEAAKLKDGQKKVVTAGKTEVLLIRHAGTVLAVQPKCPHAGGPLVEGAVCNGRLVCPWHMGTFALPDGSLLEPPAMQGLKTYAVRTDGDDVLVDPDSQAQKGQQGQERVSDERTFLLVGGGAAGAMAAAILRQGNFTGRIVVVDPIADEPVDRTQLTKQALSGEAPLNETQLGTFDEFEVERVTASTVSLNSKRREVRLSDGRELKFDAALIATGGAPQRLEVPGADEAYTIRHTEDVQQILAIADQGKEVAIVGTSFIGLEAASALAQKGLKVTVIGKDKLPFAKKFGDRVAKALIALHESKGVTFRLEVEIAAVSSRSVVIVERDGKQEKLAADLVVMGVGVAPNLKFEHDLPLAGDGSVLTDESLKAGDGVWVAGDIANVRGIRIEHWRVAQQHGMIAARQMLGATDNFHGVPFFWTFHFGKRLGYLGSASEWDEIVFDGNVEEFTFLAFYLKAGRVAAVLGCEREHETAALAEIMREKPTLAELRSRLS